MKYSNGYESKAMKIKYDRYTISLIPENEQDVAFIEDTMRLSKDGDEISLERIDAKDEEMGFRLETDIPSLPEPIKRNAPHPSVAKGLPTEGEDTFERDLDDLIDVRGSWDGPPYTRSKVQKYPQTGGGTKVDNSTYE